MSIIIIIIIITYWIQQINLVYAQYNAMTYFVLCYFGSIIPEKCLPPPKGRRYSTLNLRSSCLSDASDSPFRKWKQVPRKWKPVPRRIWLSVLLFFCHLLHLFWINNSKEIMIRICFCDLMPNLIVYEPWLWVKHHITGSDLTLTQTLLKPTT